MSESEYIPVRPNINNNNTKSSTTKLNKSINPMNNPVNSMNSSTSGYKASALENSKDPDIQQIIGKKKMNTLSLETEPTAEEQKSKEQSSGTSWVIIGLAIVIIILIIIIIYFVLKYNTNLTNTTLIPASAIKPGDPNIIRQNFGTVIPKPNNFTDPTERELDSFANKLSTATNKVNASSSQNKATKKNIIVVNPTNKIKASILQNEKIRELSPIEELDESSITDSVDDHIDTTYNDLETSDELDLDKRMESNLRDHLGINDDDDDNVSILSMSEDIMNELANNNE
jgi:hypothetical protein